MKQLLSRKSKQKVSEEQQNRTSTPLTSQSATELPAMDMTKSNGRAPPIRTSRQNPEPPLFPGVKADGKLDVGRNGNGNGNGDVIHGNWPRREASVLTSRDNTSYAPSSHRSEAGSVASEQRKVVERSQIFASSKSGPPRVVIDTDPEKASYRRCEDEPIHTPGAVQTYGALLGLKYDDHGRLEVRIASENTRKILGYGPEQLFELDSFLDILKQDFHDEFVARVNHALGDVEAIGEETRLDVLQMVLTFPYEPDLFLWCAIHLAPYPERMVICEFEEYDNAAYLSNIDAARIVPLQPFSLMDADVSREDFAKSTTTKSQPLPVFQIARKRENKEFSSFDLFNAMGQAEKQISKCQNIQPLLDVVVGIIAELTGFHRVMFYRFDSQMNGCVDAELLNPQASRDIFRGLHYPASDIPKQAQKLYMINRIRMLHDRDATTARLVCRNEADFDKPLDLTHSYLRAMSPIHNKYLANMGVRSTMSISIVINDKLWGLIACHGYGDNGVRVSLPIRELCRNIGDCAAINIQRILMQERLQARRSPAAKPTSYLDGTFTSSADLLKLVDADFALLSVGDKPKAIGKLEPYGEAVAILLYLQSCHMTTMRCSQNIKVDFPGFHYPPGLKTIAGLLFIPLNVGEGNDFLVFFRRVKLREVKWAGNPYDKSLKPGSEYLDPRKSFKRWVETISGTSREWTEDQLDTASVLGMMYDRFIDIWPAKGGPIGSDRLSSIRTTSEKLRPTLGSVAKSLEMAIEYSTDNKMREILVRAEKSSTSLMHVLEHIVKLTGAEDTQSISLDGTFNPNTTASNIMRELQIEAERKKYNLIVMIHAQKLPPAVKGDIDRFKQVLVYFTDNAFKFATSARVEITAPKEGTSTMRLTFQDSGPEMTEDQLDNIFRDFEEAQNQDDWPLINKRTATGLVDDASNNLSEVAKYIKEINGQIWVASEANKGTTFTIELPFEPAPPDPSTKPRKLRNLLLKKNPNKPPEIQIIRDTTTYIDGWPRSNQFDSAISGYSAKSGTSGPYPNIDSETLSPMTDLNVLVAESNPATLRLLDERLSQWGHRVDIAANGEECHERFAADPSRVDVILMDLDMPLVDGSLATRMIRFSEMESKHRTQLESRFPPTPGYRVAIIAFSEFLQEDSRFDYIQSGFDGWMMKPIDLGRLDIILQGVKNPIMRREALYASGQWSKGGWFTP